MTKKVLVLGSSGYIGSKIPRFHDNAHFYPYREFSDALNTIEFDIVLNLAASKAKSNPEESLKANFDFPKNILNSMPNFGGKWIQISSYYELQIPYGRSDDYSIHKAAFRNYIEEKSGSERKFKVLSLFLPHIFGANEKNTRLIPSLKNLECGKVSEFGHQKQFIPLLEVNDAVNGILDATVGNFESGSKSLKPFWSGDLAELIKELGLNENALALAKFRRQANTFDHLPIEFPESINGFLPKFDINQLREQIRRN